MHLINSCLFNDEKMDKSRNFLLLFIFLFGDFTIWYFLSYKDRKQNKMCDIKRGFGLLQENDNISIMDMNIRNIIGGLQKDSTQASVATNSENMLETLYENAHASEENSMVGSPKSAPAFEWPIAILYRELRKDYKTQGYNDAMVNSNAVFRDMNKDIIFNNILMMFREVRLRYTVMQSQVTTGKSRCEQMGLFDDVVRLSHKESVIQQHVADIEKMEESFRMGKDEGANPLKSYECGFLRGVSVQALSVTSTMMDMPSEISDIINNK